MMYNDVWWCHRLLGHQPLSHWGQSHHIHWAKDVGCREEALVLINICTRCLARPPPWQGTLAMLKSDDLVWFSWGGVHLLLPLLNHSAFRVWYGFWGRPHAIFCFIFCVGFTLKCIPEPKLSWRSGIDFWGTPHIVFHGITECCVTTGILLTTDVIGCQETGGLDARVQAAVSLLSYKRKRKAPLSAVCKI